MIKESCTWILTIRSQGRAEYNSKIMSLMSVLAVLVIAVTTCSAQSNLDLAGLRRCARLSVERTCTSNIAFIRNRLERLVNCGQSEAARFQANYCTKDDDLDLYCGAAEVYSRDLGDALFTCASALQPGGLCSNDCRNSLTSIRDELGCCINAFYNNTVTYALFAPVLSYSLWSSCGVAQPNDTSCVGALPYTLPTTPEQTCTYSDIIACRAEDINEIQNSIDGDANCGAFLQYVREVCSVDANGEGCIVGLPTDLATTIPSIATDCSAVRSTQSCSSACRESLEGFVDGRGCCVNTLYNSTYSQATGLNFSASFILEDNMLFDLCEVEPPPLTCTDGSLPLKSFSLMMLLPLIIMSLLAPGK